MIFIGNIGYIGGRRGFVGDQKDFSYVYKVQKFFRMILFSYCLYDYNIKNSYLK